MDNTLMDIYKIVEYYKTEGRPDYSILNIKNLKPKDIYELIEFYENYIINYNLYVYDILSQELFLKLLRTRKINGLDIILEKKLDEIKKRTNNPKILDRIAYIKENSYKINSIKKMQELIQLLKELKVENLYEIENLCFMIQKLAIIKQNRFTVDDIKEIKKFVNKFDLSNKDYIKKELDEIILDKNNIDSINTIFKKEMDYIKRNNMLDKLIAHCDKIKN